jgi:transaldolase/glucose-6-phosphate isomerase
VKNPSYPATLYVDGLVAPDTVNTMPLATLEATARDADPATFATNGTPSAALDPADDLAALREAGVDLDDVTDTLLRDGITAFVTPMESLLRGIESARQGIATQRPADVGSVMPAALADVVGARIDAAAHADVAARITRRDDTLWGPAGQAEVADRLGWLTAPDAADPDDLEAFAAEVRADGIQHVVLLGMGGSSLAPEVIRAAGGDREGHPRLRMLDSTDAAAVRAVEDAVDPPTTLFVVATKSGGTIETLSAFEHFHAVMTDAVGAQACGSHFVAITDPGSSLVDISEARGFRRTFLGDPDIGGRYSALSPFGLVPAALMGADVRALVAGGAEAARAARQPMSAGLWLGCALGGLAERGRDKVTFAVDAPLGAFGLWVEQLIAESTGKSGKGALPVADEPLAGPPVYGEDRVFVHLRDEEAPDGDHEAALGALAAAGHPVLTLPVRGADDLGRVFFVLEHATAVAGWVLGVNPFDQPNVAEAKAATKAVLAEGLEGAPERDADDEALAALVRGLAPPEYLAVMGYLEPTPAFDAAVAELRTLVRDATRATTTFGYGPRFLHSTGQFHKGGPPVGRFLQLVHDAPGADADIPGQTFGFTTLKHAQALGDLRTLRATGRPAERVTLPGGTDAAGALRELTARLRTLL